MASVTIINTDGTIDHSILPAGYIEVPLAGFVLNETTCFDLQSDNKMIVAGYGIQSSTGNQTAFIGRLNEGGSYDTTFNGCGIDTFHNSSSTFFNDVELFPNGKILVTGGVYIPGSHCNGAYLVRMKLYNDTLSLGTPKSQPENMQAVVFPNPAHTGITITAQNITNLIITNFLGQEMYSQYCNAQTIHLDVAGLPSGVYFVKVNSEEARKFVKE